MQQPHVSRQQSGPQRRQCGEPSGAVIPILDLDLIALNVEDQVLVRGQQRHDSDVAQQTLNARMLDLRRREADHQAA